MVRGHSPSWLRAGSALTPSRVRARFRPSVEWLEDRRLLSVTSLLDDGSEGTLRSEIAKGEGLSITFAVSGTIQLTQGALQIHGQAVNIQGPGANFITISGNGLSSVFDVDYYGRLNLSGVTIADGLADVGGGILNSGGTLELTDVVFRNNRAVGSEARRGGGLANLSFGSATLSNVTFIGNSAQLRGGAIYNQGGLTVENTLFQDNVAPEGAALLNDSSGFANISNATFLNNAASVRGGAISNQGGLFADGVFFQGNTAPVGAALVNDGNGVLATYNLADLASIVDNNTEAGFDVIVFTVTPFTATVGEPLVDRVLATFSDSAPGAYNVTLDWGDGPEAGTVVFNDGTGLYEIQGTHTYDLDTTFHVSITLFKGEDRFLVQNSIAVLTEDQANALTDFELVTAVPGDEVVIANSSGVAAALVFGGPVTDPLPTLFVGTFAGNPEAVGVAGGLVFYDVRVTNAPPGSVLTVTFQYPAAAGAQVNVQYFDIATNSYKQVNAPTFIDPVAHTVTIVLSGSSIPELADIGQTVFTIALAPAQTQPTPVATATTTINPFIVSASNTASGQVTAPISTSFSSSSPVTLTLTPLQQSTLRGSQSAVGGSEAAAEGRGAFGIAGGGGDEVPFKWVWNLLRLDDFLQWLQPPTGRMEEAQPPPMDEPLMETWLEMPLFFPGQGLSAPAAPAASADAAPLLPALHADELVAQDAQRLACIGLAFAGAVGLCAEKRRRASRYSVA